MIRIKRSDIPASLNSMRVRKSQKVIQEMIESGKKPKSTEFEAHWGVEDVRRALWEMQNGKCCYCERKRDLKRESDIEHFRPKTEIAELQKDEFGYWWLAYEWTNLFFSCRTCNQDYKKSRFPVFDESKRAKTKDCILDSESSYLINPEAENPEDFIAYDWGSFDDRFVLPIGKDSDRRGYHTIEILGLHREELLIDRASDLQLLRGLAMKMAGAKQLGNHYLIDEASKEIFMETSSERRFSGFRRYFFRAYGFGEYVNAD
jgi:uncharacterized protein (TIGR02646 family)